MLEFISLNIAFVLLTIQIIALKTYKTPLILLYWGVLIIYITPSYYAFFGGETYRRYTINALDIFYLLGFAHILITILTLFAQKLLCIKTWKIESGANKPFIAFNIFLLFVILYVAYYWNEWPLLKAISGEIVDRPDIVGGTFQGYFFISSLISIIMPAYFFHYYSYKKRNKYVLAALFLLVSFLLTIGGNKGLFLYFVIFTYFTLSTKKVNIKYILSLAFIGVFLYATMKGVNVTSDNLFDYLFESIFRRVFITQGISGPNLLQLDLNGIDLNQFNDQDIKSYLFEYTYGYSPGSMPIPYLVEFFVRYGLFVSISISLITMLGLVVFFNILDKSNIVNQWLIFYVCYLIVMSGFSSSNIYRLIAVITFAFIYSLLSKSTKKKTIE